MTTTSATASDFVAMRHPPSDPQSRRLRGSALAVAVALHAGVITLLLLAKLPERAPPEPTVYDLVFVAPPTPAPSVSAAPAQPALPSPPAVEQPPRPPTIEPAPAPVQMVMPLPPPERPRPLAEVPHPPPRTAEAPTPTPAAAAPAVPAGAAPAAAPTAVFHPPPDPAYAEALLSRLGRYKEYPMAARQRRLQGRVILRLAVARSGRVEATSVEQSSGADILDEAALEMVHRADPLPPLPPSFPGPVAEFRVPIDFALAQR